MLVWLRKMVFLLHIFSVEAGGKHSEEAVQLLEKSVINMI
jgi:hypothetical protein